MGCVKNLTVLNFRLILTTMAYPVSLIFYDFENDFSRFIYYVPIADIGWVETRRKRIEVICASGYILAHPTWSNDFFKRKLQQKKNQMILSSPYVCTQVCRRLLWKLKFYTLFFLSGFVHFFSLSITNLFCIISFLLSSRFLFSIPDN